MASAADSKTSKFEILTLTKDDKVIRLEGKMTSFDYYESLLSPNITARLTYVDTGGGSKHDKKYDNQERLGTIYNTLPITANGSEEVKFKLTNILGTLDFTTKPLVVNGAVNPDQESNRESVILNLVSKSAITNQEKEVKKNYYRSSTNSLAVKKIGSDLLGINIDANPTKNKYPFIGNKKSPFDIIMMLAAKSVPPKGNPGYFFYETRDGHKFSAIDNLIDKPVAATYYRTDVNKSSVTTDNNFKISKFSVVKNQNLINALKSGVYSNRTIFFNPKTFKEEERDFKIGNLEKALGKTEVPKPESTNSTRTLFSIKDVGALSPDAKETKEYSSQPEDWQGKVQMRYNLLMAQVVKIQVPLNPNLKAGDILLCNFEMISEDGKKDGTPDPVQSGKYLILDLCHHYDVKRTFTSMTLVRDTYGLYTSKN